MLRALENTAVILVMAMSVTSLDGHDTEANS